MNFITYDIGEVTLSCFEYCDCLLLRLKSRIRPVVISWVLAFTIGVAGKRSTVDGG